MPSDQLPVTGSGFHLLLGDRNGIAAVALGDSVRPLPMVAANDGLEFSPGDEIIVRHRATAIEADADADAATQPVPLHLFLPIESVVHLPEFHNVGRRLDASMPVGEKHECRPVYNFVLVDLGDVWVRINTENHKFRQANVEVHRHELALQLSFAWDAPGTATIAVFASMEAAIADWRAWVERTFPTAPLKARTAAAEWVHDTRIVITCDMLRSTWEVVHDYDDVARLARELHELGCPSETLFYLPGWHGAYDSTHPTYRPQEELGGDDGFRRLVETLHGFGYRVMVHATGWGIDPYHPDIDELESMILRFDDGVPRGWQLNERWIPEHDSVPLVTGRVPISAPPGARAFELETPAIPTTCEALITVGGVRIGGARLRLRLRRRAIASPPGWFESNDHFDFPYPLVLEAGVNRIAVELDGDGEADWSEAWYEVRYSMTPSDPYTSWTWPILVADVENDDYVEIFTRNLKAVVEEFGIDAVHVDATSLDEHWGAGDPRKLMHTLRDALGTAVVCGEAVGGFEDLGYWVFAQTATQSLTETRRAPADQGSLAMASGLTETLGWLDQTSPVCDFAKEYVLNYPHLCASNAFVPVGKVCNTFAARRMPATDEEHWRVLRGARRLDYVPGLRVNYREFGLDEQARLAVQELTRD